MDRSAITGKFFQTLNKLDWEGVEPFFAECSILRIPGHVKVARKDIVDHFKLFLQNLENLQIHIQEMTTNEHSVWAYTDIMPHNHEHHCGFWAFKFDDDDKIVMLKLYTDL